MHVLNPVCILFPISAFRDCESHVRLNMFETEAEVERLHFSSENELGM